MGNTDQSDRVSLDVIDPRQADSPQRLDRACSELGFFRIPASLIPDGVVEAAWDAATSFFAQPAAVKDAVGFPDPGYPYGYSPFRFETLAASLGDTVSGPDLKESFSVGPDCLGPDHVGPVGPGSASGPVAGDDGWIRSPSLWPEAPEGFREAWETCYGAMSRVAADLMSAMAAALGLNPQYFSPFIDRHGSAMRALHYPALNGADAGDQARTGNAPTGIPAGSIRAGAHSDYGTLTILVTDGVPGLEVRHRDGTWRAVDHRPGTYVVNLGDSVAQWTNDRWRSTVHRVTTVSAEPRQSMAFFHMANWDATIECLPTCHDRDNPPRYPPVQAGPWLLEKFNRSVG